jgi:tRNA nucleotidyltransferase/poly(A) polymerase
MSAERSLEHLFEVDYGEILLPHATIKSILSGALRCLPSDVHIEKIMSRGAIYQSNSEIPDITLWRSVHTPWLSIHIPANLEISFAMDEVANCIGFALKRLSDAKAWEVKGVLFDSALERSKTPLIEHADLTRHFVNDAYKRLSACNPELEAVLLVEEDIRVATKSVSTLEQKIDAQEKVLADLRAKLTLFKPETFLEQISALEQELYRLHHHQHELESARQAELESLGVQLHEVREEFWRGQELSNLTPYAKLRAILDRAEQMIGAYRG